MPEATYLFPKDFYGEPQLLLTRLKAEIPTTTGLPGKTSLGEFIKAILLAWHATGGAAAGGKIWAMHPKMDKTPTDFPLNGAAFSLHPTNGMRAHWIFTVIC